MTILHFQVPVEVPLKESTVVQETPEPTVQEKVVTNISTKPSPPQEQVAEVHPNTNGETSSKNLDLDVQKSDLQSKTLDGKYESIL